MKLNNSTMAKFIIISFLQQIPPLLERQLLQQQQNKNPLLYEVGFIIHYIIIN